MERGYKPAIERYMELLALDHSQIRSAHAAWVAIEPHMPKLIDEFYEHLFAAGLEDTFRGKNIPVIKKAQHSYWRSLFLGEFDTVYQAHVDKIGSKHRAAGVGLTEYIGAYAWFSERFFQIIGRYSPPKPHRRYALLVATNKLIYLDMMIATSDVNAHFV